MLYDQLVQIVEGYLGPAAPKFLTRQIAFHLKKNPEEITEEDLPKLAEWVRVSLGLLTADQIVVEKCVGEIEALSKNTGAGA